MPRRIDIPGIDEALHAAEMESLERRIMELALERTGARSGAVFLWDEDEGGLAVAFHVAEGVFVNLSHTVVRRRDDGRPNGIAWWVHRTNAPYLCNDTAADPHYAPYFLDVGAVAGVPIPYQRRSIGVLTVSSHEGGAFTDEHVAELQAVARSAAKFLRRAQLARASGRHGRVLLIKGLSAGWLEVERQLERAAPTDAPVLLQGESGTGKELLANAIHFNSRRARKPFVVVNCAAIPETLLESTLFGHVRGAFTGASFKKIGEFEKADGGTLFLDEVGELPPALQPKVLRAVEVGELQPLGSNDPPRKVDVRLVCATNRELPEMVREGRFREDLYYRLSLITMRLPSLRDYRHNLPILAHVYLHQAAARHGKEVTRLSPAAASLLEAHTWPGNVRELRNTLEHAVIMAAGEAVEPEDLPAPLRAPATPPAAPSPGEGRTLAELREQWLAPRETRYLTELLRACDGRVQEAARRAGVNRVTLYRLLRKRGLALTRDVRPRR